ncbi:MAG: heme-degrading monooxygenase HmoA [Myxococcota bacterium]|jgi:heme-degrading monooxygenase HmoA
MYEVIEKPGMPMPHVSAINCIEVPPGSEETAEEIREVYVACFRRLPGFVSSTFYRATLANDRINYVNIVVWESREAYDAVVNQGFSDAEGTNADGMKVLGKGFPSPIVVHPGLFEVIGS